MTAATYQYVDLPDASVVTTRALLTARENISDTVAARAMMCIHGGAGFGKTLAVNTCLRALEPGEDVRKITFRARPTARAVRYELFTALDLAGEPPRHPSEFDRLLKTALAERPRTFLVDEAQWLRGRFFPLFHPVIGCFASFLGSRQEIVFSPVKRRAMRSVIAMWITASERLGRVS